MILYACIAAGAKTLVHHDPDIHNPLSPLAAQCLSSAPKLHTHYTHTVRGRIYAFLVKEQNKNDDDRLIFFAIAEEPLGHANLLLFLHRLRDAYQCHRNPNEQLNISSKIEELTPSPHPVPASVSLSPQVLKELEEEEKGGGCSTTSGLLSEEKGVEMEIAVVDERPVNGRRKEVERIWRQQVRVVVVFDVVICSVMFGIWLTLCRGFQCIN